MIVTIDRIEGAYAVVELPDRTMVNLSLQLIPNAVEGDIVDIKIDKTANAERKTNIDKLAKKLWAD